MPPGLLFVSSRLSSPTTLTPDKFCHWYENTHIQEVTALEGVPSAVRYEAEPLPSHPGKEDGNGDGKKDAQKGMGEEQAQWLTLYEMPDIDFRHTSAFKGLDGQSEPEKSLLEGVFRQARFDTRFYELVDTFVSPQANKTKAVGVYNRLVCTAALQPPSDTASREDFTKWYQDEHYATLSTCPGYQRTRRYELVSGTILEKFERRTPDIGQGGTPKYLAVHEFEDVGGEGFPWKELQGTAETEWAKRVMGGLVGFEVGWWRGKRGYGEE